MFAYVKGNAKFKQSSKKLRKTAILFTVPILLFILP